MRYSNLKLPDHLSIWHAQSGRRVLLHFSDPQHTNPPTIVPANTRTVFANPHLVFRIEHGRDQNQDQPRSPQKNNQEEL
jgi:hypothetical protein